MNVRPVLVSVVMVVLVVAGAVAFVPFEAAEHTTRVDGSVSRAVAGNATAEFDRPVTVYVEGGGWAAGAVGHFLVGDLRAAGIDATQTETLDDTDGPILAVRVLDVDAPLWPLSPSASASWRFVYVPSGNATFVREHLASPDGPVVDANETPYALAGRFTLRDDARGVVSIPKVRETLADRIAATTAERLQATA